MIVIFAVQILEGGTIARPPLFPSGYVPTSWEMLEYIDKSPTPFIYGYNYKTNKVPKIPLIPPPPLGLPSHAHARYKNVQNTPLLRTTEPNLFQTLESLNSDQISKVNWLNSFDSEIRLKFG